MRGLAAQQANLVNLDVLPFQVKQIAAQVFVQNVNQTRVQEKPVLRAPVHKPVPLMTLVVIAQAAVK